MSTYLFTFLNCSGSTSQNNTPDNALETLTKQLADSRPDFQKIISSPDSQAQLTAKAIQQSNSVELVTDHLWGVDPNHQKNSWGAHLQAGNALKSLFGRPPGHYLIISHGEILSYTIFSILGRSPQGALPDLPILVKPGTALTVKFDLSDIKWNFQRLTQIDALHSTPAANGYRFSLIRHGESMGNVQRVFQGQKDFPLSENGKRQAELTASRLGNGNSQYHKIIASPLTRTMQTAESISSKLSLPVEVDDLWIEINNGKLAGMPGIISDEDRGTRKGHFNPFEPVGEYGESWWDLYLRGGEALQNLLHNPPGNYLVVSHGGTLNAVLWNILGTPPQPGTLTHTIYFENTGIANVSYNPESRKWQLISHLPGARS